MCPLPLVLISSRQIALPLIACCMHFTMLSFPSVRSADDYIFITRILLHHIYTGTNNQFTYMYNIPLKFILYLLFGLKKIWCGMFYGLRKLCVLLLGKKFLWNFISNRDGAKKKYRNKAEMKERKKTTLRLQKYTADVGQSSCVLSSLPCFCSFLSSIRTWDEV